MTNIEAKLENRGKGTLEFTDGVLRFSVERGRFKKKSEVIREIPLTDIENATLTGNELSITWKGVADVFLVEKPELANPIFEEVYSALKKQKETVETEKATPEAPKELIDLIKASFEITDSLFDILRSLHSRVNWTRVANLLKRSEEIGKSIPSQKYGPLKIDFTKSALAIRNNRPEEISKEVYENLNSLISYLNETALNNILPQETHPNYEDAKQMLLAYYALNDIILGETVGDKESSKERNHLAALLKDLAKTTKYSLDVDTIIRANERIAHEKIEESLVSENRTLFKQQFACLVAK